MFKKLLKIGEHYWLDICISSPQLIAWLFSNDRPGPPGPSSVSANGGPGLRHGRTQPAAAECFNQARVTPRLVMSWTHVATVPSRVTPPIPGGGTRGTCCRAHVGLSLFSKVGF